MKRVYLDANILISAFKFDGPSSEYAWTLLRAVEGKVLSAVTSELTLAELLPRPIAEGDRELVELYSPIVAPDATLSVVAVSREILIGAARLRASRAGLKLPDAIHLATAVAQECQAFLTEDVRMPMPAAMRRLGLTDRTLNDLLSAP